MIKIDLKWLGDRDVLALDGVCSVQGARAAELSRFIAVLLRRKCVCDIECTANLLPRDRFDNR